MVKDDITPVLEPSIHNDEKFLKQVREFVAKDDFVYMIGNDSDVLVDRQSIPIFDIKPAEYGMVSSAQLINSITYLRFGANTIKRLLIIIDEEENDGREKGKS